MSNGSFTVYWLSSSLILLVCGLSMAQTNELRRLSIIPVSPPSEGIPVFRDYPDKAALIIYSSLSNLAFDSNMGGIVDQRSETARGRYILIIEPFTQIMQVNAPGFMTGRFRVAAPQARDVLYFEINPKEQKENLIPVIFNVQPDNTRLYVDDQLTEINRIVQLEPGLKKIRLEREGFRALKDTLLVSPQNNQFSYQLEEVDIARVKIKTRPPGALVRIDGINEGATDRSGLIGFFRMPGHYLVEVSLNGYVSKQRVIEVREDHLNSFHFELERNAGFMELSVKPEDALVLINRREYDSSRILELSPGLYRLEVTREGYDDHREDIRILRNQTVQHTIVLNRQKGGFRFSVAPTTAKVVLADTSGREIKRWTGLNEFFEVGTGRYHLTVQEQGYEKHTEWVRIAKDSMIEIRVELKTKRIEESDWVQEGTPVISGCGADLLDIDGNSYETIQIGNQCWMAENLRTGRYRNGERIPNVTSSRRWRLLSAGAWVHYQNDSKHDTTYGRLYNWYALSDSRGLCPPGWRVPSNSDWAVLINYIHRASGTVVNRSASSSYAIGGMMKEPGIQLWKSPNSGASNKSGFSGLPGGYRDDTGSFSNLGNMGYWWSSNRILGSTASMYTLSYRNGVLNSYGINTRSGLSVRCIRD